MRLRALMISCVLVAAASADSKLAKTCPKTFKLAETAGACATGNQLPPACDYPEGRCECATPRVCSGVPHPAPPLSTAKWTCAPVVRADGCPGVMPVDATACIAKKLPKAGCSYMQGCAGMTKSCVSGRWKTTAIAPPPP